MPFFFFLLSLKTASSFLEKKSKVKFDDFAISNMASNQRFLRNLRVAFNLKFGL